MNTPEKPDQDGPSAKELLEGIVQGAHKRGHHKIIIGAAPGVGKTYRMLEEAQNLTKLGVDVAVGIVETHGRKDTLLLLEGLEVIARKQIPYKGISLDEMDTDAIIARHPKTVLVDELAHTNAKGSRHEKRYEDVEEILNAGISVVSTLNIQHIESLNDIVTRITGIQVHERVPDFILDEADEVVLVDISVEELQERLKKGKIYTPEKIEQSLNNFFKKGNLVALRELALREVSDSVEEQAYQDPISCPLELTGIHERILVCISAHPDAQRLIRRGYRVADHFSGDFIVLYVQLKNRPLLPEYVRSLENHKQLIRELKGEYIEVKSDNIVDAVVAAAMERKATQIIVGESFRDTRVGLFSKPIPYQIFERTNNIDVYIVASDKN